MTLNLHLRLLDLLFHALRLMLCLQDGLRVGEPSSVRASGGDIIRGAEPSVRTAGGHPESRQFGPQLPHQR